MSVGLKFDQKSVADLSASFKALGGRARRITGALHECMEYAAKVEYGTRKCATPSNLSHMRPAMAMWLATALPKMANVFKAALQSRSMMQGEGIGMMPFMLAAKAIRGVQKSNDYYDRVAVNAVAAAMFEFDRLRLQVLHSGVYSTDRWAAQRDGRTDYKLTGSLRQNRIIAVSADVGGLGGETGYDENEAPVGSGINGQKVRNVPTTGDA